ncbi:helix-turn-helix domain-containing protein [Amycolatopsis sp. CA-161197]|uniref:helix-turn-helix domain-containing protein n=1 Tax=Amycolatopsis sp. CA-161197 TaxID=3239922 RepID=UPI003D8DF92F
MGDDDIGRPVARKLQQGRADRGLTLTHLAELTGIAQLSRLERREPRPSIGSPQVARTDGASIGSLPQLAPTDGASIGSPLQIAPTDAISIGSPLQLARTYGTSIGKLVADQPGEEYHLVRAGQGVAHENAEGRDEVLSGPRATIAVVRLELVPGTETGAVHHAGERRRHVRDGARSRAPRRWRSSPAAPSGSTSGRTHRLHKTTRRSRSGPAAPPSSTSGRTHRLHNPSARATRVGVAFVVHHSVCGSGHP